MLLPNLGALRLREAPTGAFPLAQLPQNLFDLVVEKLVAQMVVGSEEPDMCAQVELTCNQLHLALSQLRKDGLFIDPKYDCSNPDAEVWKAAHAAFGVDPDEVQRTKEAGVSWKYNFHTLCRVFTTPMTFEVDAEVEDQNPEHPHKWVSEHLWEWLGQEWTVRAFVNKATHEPWSCDLKEMLRNPKTQNRHSLAKILIALIDDHINANYLELPPFTDMNYVDDDGNEYSRSGESTRAIFKDDSGVKCECCGRFGDDTATKIRKYLRDISAFRNLLRAMIPEP
tara:strand:+ start:287 stop:1132 length:846 start_codon:yes stop_codon:yes gene_type:complete